MHQKASFNRKKISKLFTSIAFRISISIAFVVAGTTIFVASFILKEERAILGNELKNRSLYIVRIISHQLIEPLLYEDRYTIYSILKSSTVEEKDIIVFAEVFDSQGETIVKTDDDISRFKPIEKTNVLNTRTTVIYKIDESLTYEILSPIESKGIGIIGYLRLCITQSYLLDMIKKTTEKLYLFSAVIILIGILTGLWMARKIIRPVLIPVSYTH
ncbi:MAG: hypothetical protein N2738_09100, partial [Thermodesulfovibrionales bacterium]|nr:hypothetical protein [Thermodesulfovibrionales bacterium]